VAVGRSILVIVWHLLADPNLGYHDLGPGFYDTHVNAERAKRNHVRQLEALGSRVTSYLLPDPAPIHRPGPGSRSAGCCRLPANRGSSDRVAAPFSQVALNR
jgi:hypothetical protein